MINASTEEIKRVSGAGGGCFRKGTQVQLEGGKTISIEDLKVGDEVLAFDENGKVKLAKVTKVHFHEDPQPILSVKYWRGKMTGITPNHWVLNQYGNFAEMGTLAIEDALVDGMGHLRPIIDVALIGCEPVWNLTVEPYHTFIADGIRVHNGGHRDRFPVVSGAGGGGGKGGGGGMTEAPDSLLSKAVVSIVDLLGEGQIAGLVNGAQSVYFNDVPLMSADGTWNYSVPNQLDPVTGQLLPVTFSYQFRDGQQNQSPITGFSDVETPHAVEVRAQYGTPAVISITNPNVNAVRLIAEFPALTSQDPSTGSIYGTNVSFQFMISVNGLAYQNLSGPLTVNGKSRSKYQISYQYGLPTRDQNGEPALTWSIQLVRLTPDSTSSLLNNETWLNSYVEIIYANLSYPNSAMIAYTLDSSQFSSIPKRTYLVNGLYIQVPSNYDPVNRVYSGVWDGTFKIAFSNNPAWVMYDLLTNERYGLGQFIAPSQIDKAKLYQIGQYCDGMVSDGYGGLEPRFTVNAWIRDRQDAYRLISGLASVFNGMTFWGGGMVSFMQDAPDTPVMVFTPANVVDGVFNYTGTSRKDRHSAVLVSWSDPSQYYRQVIEYVEDQTLVAKYGLKTKDVVAFGCTSRGQAHRAGKWILYTEEYQSNLITFSVGLDAALVLPGDIIKIHDTTKAGKRLGGRLLSCTSTSATLDAPVTLNDGAEAIISIRMPDGSFVDNVLAQSASSSPVQTVSWTTPLPELPLANAIWIIAETNLQPMLARVVGVTQGKVPGSFDIAAVEHNPSKYGYIENNLALVQPKLTDLNIIPAVPTGLTVSDSIYIAGGTILTKMVISWDRTQPGITSWKVIVRCTSLNDNWQTFTTNSPFIEIPSVQDGQVYDVRVFSINNLGKASGNYAEVPSYTVIGKNAPPSNVTNFTATYNTLLGVQLSWTGVPDVDLATYEIRSGINWATGTLVAQVLANQLTIGSLPQGTYNWMICALDTTNHYSSTPATLAFTVTPSSAPSNLTSSFSGTQITLNWAEPLTYNQPILDYQVSLNGTVLATSKTTSYSAFIKSGTVQNFSVVAVDSAGNASAPATLTVNIPLPNAPVVSSALIASGGIELSWTDTTSGLSIASYEVRQGATWATATYIGSINGLNMRVSANYSGTETFWVAGIDSAGNYGTPGSVAVLINLPSSPTVSEAISGTTLSLSWTATTGSFPINHYEVRNGSGAWSSATLVSDIKSNSISIPINWLGAATFQIETFDNAGNASAPASIVATVYAPSAPTITPSFSLDQFVLNWTVPSATLPIDHYEIRYGSTTSSWATATSVGTIKGTTFNQPAKWVGAQRWFVAAVDVNGNVGAAQHTDVTITAPAAPIITQQVVDNNVLLYWTDIQGTLPIKTFEVRRGMVTDTWATAKVIGTKTGGFTTVFETAENTYQYFVCGIDSAGNYGTPNSITATVAQPPNYVLRANLQSALVGGLLNIPNSSDASPDILLSGYTIENTLAGSWQSVRATQGYFAGKWYWEVTINSGGTYPNGIVIGVGNSSAVLTNFCGYDANGYGYDGNNGAYYNNNTATALGATYTTGDIISVALDADAGTVTFYKNGVVQGSAITIGAGTWLPMFSEYGDGELITVNFGQSEFSYPVPSGFNGATNGYWSPGSLLMPVNTTNTFAQHFTANAWNTPQDQINAGLPIYIEPASSPGTYIEVYDYGTVLASSKITVALNGVVISGAPTVSTTISVKTNATDAWTDYTGQASIYATNFRYVKVTISVSGGTGDLYEITGLNIRLDAKLLNESGSGLSGSTDAVSGTTAIINNVSVANANPAPSVPNGPGTLVRFSTRFADVSSVTVSVASGSTAVYALYALQSGANPPGMTVLLYDASGNRVNGGFSWQVSGY